MPTGSKPLGKKRYTEGTQNSFATERHKIIRASILHPYRYLLRRSVDPVQPSTFVGGIMWNVLHPQTLRRSPTDYIGKEPCGKNVHWAICCRQKRRYLSPAPGRVTKTLPSAHTLRSWDRPDSSLPRRSSSAVSRLSSQPPTSSTGASL